MIQSVPAPPSTQTSAIDHIAREHVAATALVDPVPEPAGEERGSGVGDEDALADLGLTQRGERHATPGDVVIRIGRGQSEAVGQQCRVVGALAHDRGEQPGTDLQPCPSVVQPGARGGGVDRRGRLDEVGIEGQDPTDPT